MGTQSPSVVAPNADGAERGAVRTRVVEENRLIDQV
jgi:hypothetical protein